MAKNYSEADMGSMVDYGHSIGAHGQTAPLTGNGKNAPKSKPPKPVTKPAITKGLGNKNVKKQLGQIQKKYKGRFSRGATATPAPKHGFVPPGTTPAKKVVKP